MAGGQDKRQCNEMALSRSQQGSTDLFALAQQIGYFELNAQSGLLDMRKLAQWQRVSSVCRKMGLNSPIYDNVRMVTCPIHVGRLCSAYSSEVERSIAVFWPHICANCVGTYCMYIFMCLLRVPHESLWFGIHRAAGVLPFGPVPSTSASSLSSSATKR